MMRTVLKINQLSTFYSSTNMFGKKYLVKALNGVSLELFEKQTIGIVGESGCGKSTLAKTLVGLEKRTNGSIFIQGKNLDNFGKKELCSNIQMIFQDPYNSLNPRQKAWEIISSPLLAKGNTLDLFLVFGWK